MKCLQRLLLDKYLIPLLSKLQGKVLDTGGKDSPYRRFICAEKYEVLDIRAEFHPDYVADVHDMHMIPKESFDGILATELLEHCYDPVKVISEFRRVLKKSGVIILSVPFFYPYHPDPCDYYRYTKDGLRYLFKDFKDVSLVPYGGRFVFFWVMMTWVLPFMRIFNPLLAKLNFKDVNGPSGFIVVAYK